ncbi:alpha/beta hydrolase [Actinoplanes sp. TFC3]|uniref:alpha/beta hydrolase n=1 Tax=Actinoplanes sp. TFC3 TaxID=1710355 RepID=UPI0008314E30|nr:alpha/beta fold hydrolase [Actinoplanes sp. TFC3]
MDRLDVTFGGRAAWLYRPAEPGLHGIVVMAHGLGLTRHAGLERYAARFCNDGVAVLLFDYRGFGDSDGRPRRVVDVGAQLADWRAAVAHARSLPWVDERRVAVWGSSFSGGDALRLAAEDSTLAAAVAQCPFTDGLASALALGAGGFLRLVPALTADLLRAVTRRAPELVAAAADPGTPALMVAGNARAGYLSLTAPDGSAPENLLAARSGLAVLGYRPGASARRIKIPLLVHVCLDDAVAPAPATRKHVARVPGAEVIEVPAGHFDIYHGALYENTVERQAAFLRRILWRRP